MPIDVKAIVTASFSSSIEKSGIRVDPQVYEIASRYIAFDRVQLFIDEDLQRTPVERRFAREQFHRERLQTLAQQFAKIFSANVLRRFGPGLSYNYFQAGSLIIESQSELKELYACDMYPSSG